MGKTKLPDASRTTISGNRTHNRKEWETIGQIINKTRKRNAGKQKTLQIHEDIQYVRTNFIMRKTLQANPTIHDMLTREYTEEIKISLRQLKNRKAHGTDGIPGEVYKALSNWITNPWKKYCQISKKEDEIPSEWKQGAIVQIYKNNGGVNEFQNYRPICITQIVYKIWTILITRRLAKILHITTGTNQYGYKQGPFKTDALCKK